MRRIPWILMFAALSASAIPVTAQEPEGLAREALQRDDLRWLSRTAPGLRVHFLSGTYAAMHQDSLVARVVAAGFMSDAGVVPLDTLFTRFRRLDDLTAYLEAASLVGYIHRTWGLDAVEEIWRSGAAALPSILHVSVDSLQARWRKALPPPGRFPPPERLAEIRAHGCG